jgi:ankyrin repeat protein
MTKIDYHALNVVIKNMIILIDENKQLELLELFKSNSELVNLGFRYQNNQTTLLHCSAEKNWESLALELMKVNSSVLVKVDQQGKTPLHYAAINGHESLALQLMQANSSVLVKVDRQGKTPLHYAAINGHESLALELMQANSSVLVKVDEQGKTPLHYAAINGHESLALQLMQANSSVLVKVDKQGRTPLHYAATNGHESLALQLMQANSSVLDEVYNRENTPIHCAITTGHESLAIKLIQMIPYDFNRRTMIQKILIYAIDRDYKKLVEAIITNFNVDGNIPLSSAITKNNIEIVKLLLDAGFDPNSSSSIKGLFEFPLLWGAARDGRYEIVKLLLNAGANVDATASNKAKTTALWISCSNKHEKVINLLLVYGANPNPQNSFNKKFLFDHIKDENQAIAKLLADTTTLQFEIKNLNPDYLIKFFKQKAAEEDNIKDQATTKLQNKIKLNSIDLYKELICKVFEECAEKVIGHKEYYDFKFMIIEYTKINIELSNENLLTIQNTLDNMLTYMYKNDNIPTLEYFIGRFILEATIYNGASDKYVVSNDLSELFSNDRDYSGVKQKIETIYSFQSDILHKTHTQLIGTQSVMEEAD